MKYFPAFCDACARSFLAAVASATDSVAHPRCPRCQGRSRLIPGAYYAEPAQRSFEELERLLARARLGAPQAQHLRALLEDVTREGPASRAALDFALLRFPGLAPVAGALPEDAAELGRAVAMLLVLLTPLATTVGPGSGLRAALEPDVDADVTAPVGKRNERAG